jgi:trehalose 2-sulfotransferase
VIDSYFLCATPRTGSSLLLGLLASTGVAGRPEAYFRVPDEQSWADRWQVPGPADPAFDYQQFVRAAIRAGTSDNGVFGAKLMWGTLDELVARLPPAGTDLETLQRVFGRTRFVYLRRDDVLAQAVSWLRAEQTGTWYAGQPDGGDREPSYDPAGITAYARTIGEHNAAWRAWFRSSGVSPYQIRYEELCADLVGVTCGILDFLGLELPAGRTIRPRHQRQADQLTAEWMRRYRAEPAPG